MILAVAMTDVVAMVTKQVVAKKQRTGMIPVLFYEILNWRFSVWSNPFGA
jgi:hypothetical protein